MARTRLPPEESRSLALDAARALLLEEGPQAVTLKAVAARIGRTHANLLHHFGSAAELQRALASSMADRITRRIGAAVLKFRMGETDPKEVVSLTFDAFDREGAGALASWMLLTGDRAALEPILTAIRRLLDELGEHQGRPLALVSLGLMLTAFADALLGEPLTQALNLPRETGRQIALRQLLDLSQPQATDREA